MKNRVITTLAKFGELSKGELRDLIDLDRVDDGSYDEAVWDMLNVGDLGLSQKWKLHLVRK